MASFRLLLKLGLRNLARNRHRTLITGAGVALGIGLLIATFGVVDGLDGDLVASVTRQSLGDVQLHQKDYLTKRRLGLTFDQASATGAAAKVSGVAAVAPRVYTFGFLSSQGHSTGGQLMGIDPAAEAGVTQMTAHIVEGTSLPLHATPWKTGKALDAQQEQSDAKLTDAEVQSALEEIAALGGNAGPSKDRGALRDQTQALVAQVAPGPLETPPIVLGVRLARKLHVSPGDPVDVLLQDVNGATSSARFKVVGLLQTGTAAVDRTRALVELSDLQHLIRIEGRVHELALRTASGVDPDDVVTQLSARPELKALQADSWRTLRPDIVAMVQANDELMGTLVFVALLVAGIGVANTLLMSIFERKRELAVLKAVGMRPRGIVGLVMVETALLGLASAVAGMVLGTGIDLFLARKGIDLGHFFTSFSLAGVGLDPVLHGAITARGVAVPVVAIAVAALGAAIFPAWSASRVEPAVGMRDAT